MKRIITITLVAALVAGSALAYWRHAARAAETNGIPEIIFYAPADAKAIIYVDLAALRSSAFATQMNALGASQNPESEYLSFVQATGFDFARDLDRAALIVRQDSPGQVELAVAEGRFDQTKISAYALRSGKSERAGGADIYEVPQGAAGNPTAFTFLDKDRIALAQGQNAKAILASLLRTGRQSALDPEMQAHILRLAGSAVFAVGQISQLPENLAPGGMHSDQLDNLAHTVRWVGLGLRPEGEVLHLVVEAECVTPENANQLAGTADEFRALGQSTFSDPKTRSRVAPQIASLIDSLLNDLHISQDANRVRLTLDLTRDEIQQISQAAPGVPSPSKKP